MMVVHWKQATQMHPRVKLFKNQGRRRSTTTGRQMKQQALLINFKSPLLQALSWTTPLCSFWRQKRGKVRSVRFVSTVYKSIPVVLSSSHGSSHTNVLQTQNTPRSSSKKKNCRILIARSINDHGVCNSASIRDHWNLWSRNLCKKWHRFPSLDLLSLPFTKVNHWVFFPSLPDVQQQKLEWLLESTPSTLAFKVVIWNGSHVVMLGCWLWPGKILWIVNSSGNAHALMLLYGKLCLNGTIIKKVARRAYVVGQSL